MKASLKTIATAALTERFAAMAVEQDKALLASNTAKFNRLFDQMEAIKSELKARPGDQRSALLPLFDHPNMQVRLKAAKATLAVAPVAARARLEAIAASKCFPQAGDAGMCLVGLDNGTFKPT